MQKTRTRLTAGTVPLLQLERHANPAAASESETAGSSQPGTSTPAAVPGRSKAETASTMTRRLKRETVRISRQTHRLLKSIQEETKCPSPNRTIALLAKRYRARQSRGKQGNTPDEKAPELPAKRLEGAGEPPLDPSSALATPGSMVKIEPPEDTGSGTPRQLYSNNTEGLESICNSNGKRQHAADETGVKKPCKPADDQACPATAPEPASCETLNSPSQNDVFSPPNLADDRDYFASYGHLDIHRTMIDDSVRTQTYRRAILTNYLLFYGKTVLDVGCGTGILSVFCCQAGARRVYAVEASEAAQYARLVADENGYADRVRVLQCRVEDATLPEKVDVIVSEWMGHALLYESMLESVLVARDRWLKPGGAIFPERAVLKMALCTAPNVGLEPDPEEFWPGVHGRFGVHMSCLAEENRRIRQPARVTALLPEEVHSHAATVLDLDLRKVPVDQIRLRRLILSEGVELRSFGRAELTGFVLWFDVHFPGGETLSTSPYVEETHWGQTVLPLKPTVIDQDTCIRRTFTAGPDKEHPRNWVFAGSPKDDDDDEFGSLTWIMDGTG